MATLPLVFVFNVLGDVHFFTGAGLRRRYGHSKMNSENHRKYEETKQSQNYMQVSTEALNHWRKTVCQMRALQFGRGWGLFRFVPKTGSKVVP